MTQGRRNQRNPEPDCEVNSVAGGSSVARVKQTWSRSTPVSHCLQEAKQVFDLDESIEVPSDLDETAVGEKIRADLEVKAVARKQASG